MTDFEKQVYNIGIMPVVVLDDPDDAEPLAEALVRGGLPCAEVTFRTGAAAESICRMAKAYPDMLVGAGTVLSVEQADRAVDAGAKFIISPGLDPKVVAHCLDIGVPVVPGTATASDLAQAVELGLKTVKFFPAELNGGLKAIQALAAPYTELNFIPTGGVNPKNVSQYLGYHRILACGGTWMAKPDKVAAHAFDEIEQAVEQAVLAMLDFRVESAADGTVTVSTNRLERAKAFAKDHKIGEWASLNLIQR